MSRFDLTVSFDYSNDVGFALDPDVALGGDVLFDPADVRAFGRNEASNIFKSMFKIWGKSVQGVDVNGRGGFSFINNQWVDYDYRIGSFPPPRLLGYSNAHAPMLSAIKSTFKENDDNPVTLISFVVMNVRYAAIVADASVAKIHLSHNDQTAWVGGVQIRYPWNTRPQYAHAGTSTADVSFRLGVPDTHRIIAYGIDDKSVNKMLVLNNPFPSFSVGKNDVYENLALLVSAMLTDKLLKLVPVSPLQLTPKQAFAKLLSASHSGSEVKSAFVEGELVPPSLFDLARHLNVENMPLPPDGYFWIADVNNLLYLCSDDGSELVMPYDVIDILADIASAKNMTDDDERDRVLRRAALYQEVYDHQIRLLMGMLHNYRVFRGRDVGHP